MNTLDFDCIVRSSRILAPLPTSYRWTLFECFCDGYLVHQQSPEGIHYQALISSSYRPHQIAIAFDGELVFALDGCRVVLDRLCQPLFEYTPSKETPHHAR
jgi:hypothetical protein